MFRIIIWQVRFNRLLATMFINWALRITNWNDRLLEYAEKQVQ